MGWETTYMQRLKDKNDRFVSENNTSRRQRSDVLTHPKEKHLVIQCSCPESPVDRGAWWAAVHGVTQSRTRLKQLSMHACIGEGNGNSLQCSCLENPRDGGAWWAAVYGVTRSQTRLKRLSSSSSSNLKS